MMRNLFNHSKTEPTVSKQQGQGLAEYIIIVALVGIAIIAIIGMMSPAISDAFERLVDANAVAPPSIAGYTPPAPTSVNPTDIPDTFLLTVNNTDDTIGHGTTSPTGQSSQPSMQSVSIQANPDAGAEFIGWEGDASGTANPVSVMMNGDKTVIARFRVKCYDLTTTAVGAGDIVRSPEPNCPHNGGDYQTGTDVELRAIHAPDVAFYSWTGDIDPISDETINVTVDQDLHIEASFEVVCYTLSINSPDGHGDVVANPEPHCLSDTTRYAHGTEVHLSPQPEQGYSFERWANGDLDNTTNPGIIVMDGDKTINAYFRERCFTLTTSVSGNGSVNVTSPSTPNCSDNVGYLLNTTLTLEAVPNSGDDFLFWSGHASGSSSTVDILIIDDTSVRANFGACYPLSVSTIGAGSVITNTTPNCTGNNPQWYQRDTIVELIADPDLEYDLLNWSGDASGNAQTLNLTMNAAQDVVANFEACYTLTATSNGNGSIIESGDYCSTNGDKYAPQSDVTLRASAIPGYQFDAWSGDLVSTDNPSSITMSNNQTIAAAFIPCNGPPSPWSNQDIGSVATAGGTCYNNGTFTVNGSGNNIWGTADEFQYAYQSFDGNGYIIARVVSQQNTDGYARAGIMFREDIGSGSRNAFLSVTPSHPLRFQRRTTVGGDTASSDVGNYHAPVWLKLERIGDLFTAYRSVDGTNWTTIRTETVAMNAVISAGLAVSSHNDGTLSEVIFDNVEVQKAQQVVIDLTGNGLGVVNLTPPDVDCIAHCVETYINGTAVTLQATAQPGSTFTGWGGDLSGSTNPDTFNVTGDMNITAEFSSGGQVLFVVGNPSSLNDADTAVVSRLQSLGYAVIIIDDAAVTSADADDKILVVISSTINPNYVGTEFTNVTTPVLTWERYLYDDMLMASSAGTDGDETQIKITYPTHPMAAGLGDPSSGIVDIFTPSDTIQYGIPPENAITIATIDNNPERAVIYGYDIGDLLSDNTTPAPARRVSFIMGDSGAENLTPNGWTLFDAATDWAINGGGIPDNREQILMVSNNTTLSPADLLIFDRLQGMGYAVKVVDDNVATIADAVDKVLVVISSRSDPNYVGTEFTNVTTPVLTWERYLYDDMLMANATASDSGETQIKILYSNHPMAVTSGDPTTGLVTSSSSQNYHVARSPENAIIIASTDDAPANAAIFGYDIGDVLADGSSIAADRRVGFFIDDDGALYLNSTGWDFFDAATNWAINGGGAPDSREQILMVSNSTTLSPADLLIFDRLQGMGYAVKVVDDDVTTATDAVGKVLVVISSRSNADAVGTTFINVTTPVLTWERYLYDDMLMSNASVSDSGETQIKILYSDHPMAVTSGDPDTGVVTVSNSEQNYHVARSLGDAIIIASADNTPTDAAIFGYDIGDVLADGSSVAAGRRVGFFIDDDGASYLNSTGWDFFDAATNWAINGGGAPDSRQQIILVVGSTTLNADDMFVFNRLVYGATSYHVYALNDNDVGGSYTPTGNEDLITISYSVQDGLINDAFRDTTIPVMLWERRLYDNMQMSNINGATDGQTEIDMIATNATHPLAAGQTGTDLTVTTAGHYFAYAGGLGSGAIDIATINGNANHYVIFGYEAGSAMAGLNAPARRVGFLIAYTDTATTMNSTGWTLFDAAISWTIGN